MGSNTQVPFRDSPCRACKDRRVTEGFNCHSACEKYAVYRADIDAGFDEKKRRIELNNHKWTSRDQKRRRK